MKNLRLLVVFFIATITISCERDDICAETTATTPKLILRLYDITSQEDTKNVNGLKVTGFGDNNEELEISDLNVVNTDSINLPLRTDADVTKFTFHKEYAVDDNDTPDDVSDDFETGNPDIVTIQCVREDIFVSRACGYKTIFKELIISVEDDGDKWIINSDIINSIVENENSAHVKIFH